MGKPVARPGREDRFTDGLGVVGRRRDALGWAGASTTAAAALDRFSRRNGEPVRGCSLRAGGLGGPGGLDNLVALDYPGRRGERDGAAPSACRVVFSVSSAQYRRHAGGLPRRWLKASMAAPARVAKRATARGAANGRKSKLTQHAAAGRSLRGETLARHWSTSA